MPDGFEYDAPDPSVGWFVGYWIHEACPGTGEQEVIDEVLRSEHYGAGANRGIRVWHKLSCTECGQSTEVSDEDWDPDLPDDWGWDEDQVLVRCHWCSADFGGADALAFHEEVEHAPRR